MPPLTSARVRISGRVISEPPMPSDARESSSVAIQLAIYSPSPPSLKPPYSLGIDKPNAPISARPEIISSGTSRFSRWTCSACGASTLVAKLLKVSCTISLSSSKYFFPGLLASDASKTGSRYFCTKSCDSPSVDGSTPQSFSRPINRETKSCTMSATNAQVSVASSSPFAP